MDLSQMSLSPMPGGWSGQVFLGETGAERVVVRLYPPDPGARSPEVDAALIRFVRGLVPVPEVLEVRLGSVGMDQPGLLITSWVPGRRGDIALDEPGDGDPGRGEFGDAARTRMGASMGRLAGTLAGMPTLRAGLFVDGNLALEPFEPDLASWANELERSLDDWEHDTLRGLHEMVDVAQAMGEDETRTCLVHSDLNPKNVLVDETGEIVSLVDWEFAHSGSPWTDLGNVLRFEREPSYVEAALGGYCAVRGGVASDHLDRARAADLWALVHLAGRPVSNPVVGRARSLLQAIARHRDLHAWPEGW